MPSPEKAPTKNSSDSSRSATSRKNRVREKSTGGALPNEASHSTEYSVHSHVIGGGGGKAATKPAPEPRDAMVRLPEAQRDLPLHRRPAEAMRLAKEAFAQTGYWIAFYRAILAPGGAVHPLFPTQGEMEYFESTREFEEIHKMLAALRSSDTEKAEAIEPQKMITIRIPKSMQRALVEEAKRHSISVNKLCISKLLLPANSEFIPRERGRVRGRKPGT